MPDRAGPRADRRGGSRAGLPAGLRAGGGAACRRAVVRASAEDAFAALYDVRRHAAWIPLTRIEAPEVLEVDDEFVAVSGPGVRRGAPGLVDRMRVVARVGPSTEDRRTGLARFLKTGPVLTGWAELTVRPLGAAACEVTWTERIGLRGLPMGLTDLVSRPLTGLMVAGVLRHAARDLEAPRPTL